MLLSKEGQEIVEKAGFLPLRWEHELLFT
jgi:hypothetical protein